MAAVAGQTTAFEEAVQKTQASLKRLATRGPVASTNGVGPVLSKQGIRLKRLRAGHEEETFALGAACSEVFTGQRLAKVLRPAVDYQVKALQSLEQGEACRPLSIHTSAGIPAALGSFVEALEPHLPWPKGDDWFVNLQQEGATAVWAGVEALMQLSQLRHKASPRSMVAVGERSYHGAKTTGLGMPAQPRWPSAPRTQGQVAYPVPAAGAESSTSLQEEFLKRFDAFLDAEGEKVGCILFEPQWGSTFAARPWPAKLLQEAVTRSKKRGIFVLCDEIMCGLGRHGKGTLFLSKALELEPDGVTFGKAMGAGAYSLSGVLLRQGAHELHGSGSKMAQSHTYAGSSAVALIAAESVIGELPRWFAHAAKMGEVIREELQKINGSGFLRVDGLGLMWGGLFCDEDESRRTVAAEAFKSACEQGGVWPYFVPAGGFMITPPMDVEEGDLREGLRKLAECVEKAQAVVAADSGPVSKCG